MPIVSSVIVEDQPQRDGRRAIRERHTDQLGLIYETAWLAESLADVVAALAGHAGALAARLTATEIDANVDAAINQGVPPLTFNYSTAGQALAAVRARYATLSSWDAIRLGNYINAQGLSDAQLTNLFGVSGAALTNLKTKLANASARYAQVIAEQGQ